MANQMHKDDLSPLRARETFNYDANTGLLKWRHLHRDGGKIAGYLSNRGYRLVSVGGRGYLAHRIIWAWYYGVCADAEVDHTNGDPGDNRILNLRLATRSQNCANTRLRVDSTTGLKGVRWHRGARRWMAEIMHQRERIYLGLHDSPEAAHAAYAAAAQRLYAEFANTGAR